VFNLVVSGDSRILFDVFLYELGRYLGIHLHLPIIQISWKENKRKMKLIKEKKLFLLLKLLRSVWLKLFTKAKKKNKQFLINRMIKRIQKQFFSYLLYNSIEIVFFAAPKIRKIVFCSIQKGNFKFLFKAKHKS